MYCLSKDHTKLPGFSYFPFNVQNRNEKLVKKALKRQLAYFEQGMHCCREKIGRFQPTLQKSRTFNRHLTFGIYRKVLRTKFLDSEDFGIIYKYKHD